MNYSESMDYIEEITKNRGISLGLDNMNKMLDLLKRPENNYKIIHVCGTNGKGSISAFISSILSKAGYKVGRYISPVVADYCEKIQFSEKDEITFIDKDDVAAYISTIKEVAENNTIYPTPFEVETLMSFIAFKEYGVDYAIVECGMGGLNDATNAIAHKELCVFSSISYDHMGFLGNTIGEIAKDKAGIIKENVKIVASKQLLEVENILNEFADIYSTTIVYADADELREVHYSLEKNSFIYRQKEYSIKLCGKYQVMNAITAIESVKQLGIVSDKYIAEGLLEARWDARFEIISNNPYIIYDGAHNPDGMKVFIDSVNELFDRKRYKRIAIVGIFADKDINTMTGYMKNQFDEIHTIKAASERAMSPCELAGIIEKSCDVEVVSHENESLTDIINQFDYGVDGRDVAIFVFGSLSIYKLLNGKV